MEEEKSAHDGGDTNDARSSAASPFTNRRQKNLQKFRKHIAAQRQNSTSGSETKPEKDATPVEEKPTTETTPAAKTIHNEIQAIDDSNKPKSPPSPEEKSVRRTEAGKAGAMSPQCTPQAAL